MVSPPDLALAQPLSVDILLTIFVLITAVIFLWSLYNLSIFAAGVRRYFRIHDKRVDSEPQSRSPFISLIVPAKNEEKVIGRVLDSLLDLRYPKDRMEVFVVEDGSTDNTKGIALRYASEHPNLIRCIHNATSEGKPAALNLALQQARGNIVGVLDADNVPDSRLLVHVAKSFDDNATVAVQGITESINAQANMLTKVVSLEEAAWFKTVLNGKDHLRLFVPLTGSCQFIRSNVLRELGGWDKSSLAEDVELAARLLANGHRVRFCEQAVTSQEAPSRLSQLFRQRSRWYRGYIETAIKYGSLLTNPNGLRVDAEVTLFGPILLGMSFANYWLSWAVLTWTTTFVARILAYLMVGLTSALLLALGLGLVYLVRPRRISNFLWLPFIYAYWFLQTVIATYALSLMVLRRPRIWAKTEKTGSVDSRHETNTTPIGE